MRQETENRRKTQKKIRLMASVTVGAFFVMLLTIVVCVFVCLHFRNLSGDILTVDMEKTEQNQPDIDEEDQRQQAHSDEAETMNEEALEEALDEAREEGKKSTLKIWKDRLAAGEATLQICRDFYPEDLVVYDQGAFQFIPKNYDLKMHEYDSDLFTLSDQGRMSYSDESYEVIEGIDVSKYQGKIDWKQVKEQGIGYAIIRLGIRGYSEGSIKDDDTYVTNIEGALENNIPVGVYFFTQAIDEQESLEEAEYVLEKIKDYTLEYPVYIDVEQISSSNCRTKDLTKEERTHLIKVFLDRIREEGYEAGIYGNMKSFLLMMDLEQLEDYPKWLASYSMPLYFPYHFDILQYSETGKLSGIKEKVDLNLQLKKKDQATKIE